MMLFVHEYQCKLYPIAASIMWLGTPQLVALWLFIVHVEDGYKMIQDDTRTAPNRRHQDNHSVT